jgi:hypothetical protein
VGELEERRLDRVLGGVGVGPHPPARPEDRLEVSPDQRGERLRVAGRGVPGEQLGVPGARVGEVEQVVGSGVSGHIVPSAATRPIGRPDTRDSAPPGAYAPPGSRYPAPGATPVTSQTRPVWSSPTDTSRRPSGVNARSVTRRPTCPANRFSGRPVAAS